MPACVLRFVDSTIGTPACSEKPWRFGGLTTVRIWNLAYNSARIMVVRMR